MAKAAAKPSPFAPARLPEMPPVPGVRLAACQAGIRYQGRTDLMMAVLDPGTTVAGVLTRSKTCSAPVLWCRESLKHGKARALVVNSGNANAFTGKKGSEATRITAEAAAKAVGCSAGEVFLASTGVIGEPLDAAQVRAPPRRARQVGQGDAFEIATRAIMTTDTYPKLATRTAEIGGVPVVDQRLLQGRRHDRARHGDHALLHLHGRGHRPAALQGLLCKACADDLQLHDDRRRHLHQRHLPAVRHRRGCASAGSARIDDAGERRLEASAPPCTI